MELKWPKALLNDSQQGGGSSSDLNVDVDEGWVFPQKWPLKVPRCPALFPPPQNQPYHSHVCLSCLPPSLSSFSLFYLSGIGSGKITSEVLFVIRSNVYVLLWKESESCSSTIWIWKHRKCHLSTLLSLLGSLLIWHISEPKDIHSKIISTDVKKALVKCSSHSWFKSCS